MTDRRAVGRRSRAKGKTFEREVAALLTKAGLKAERGWWQASGARGGGAVVADVVITGLQAGDRVVPVEDPFWIECGTGATVDPRAKLRQGRHNEETYRTAYSASDARRPRRIAVSVTRRLHSRRVVVSLSLEDLLRLAPCLDGRAVVQMEVADWLRAVHSECARRAGLVHHGGDAGATDGSNGGSRSRRSRAEAARRSTPRPHDLRAAPDDGGATGGGAA